MVCPVTFIFMNIYIKKKKLQGQFVEKTMNIAGEFSGKWIRNGFLKKETDGMLFAAQEQALRTNSGKAKLDKQPVSPQM